MRRSSSVRLAAAAAGSLAAAGAVASVAATSANAAHRQQPARGSTLASRQQQQQQQQQQPAALTSSSAAHSGAVSALAAAWAMARVAGRWSPQLAHVALAEEAASSSSSSASSVEPAEPAETAASAAAEEAPAAAAVVERYKYVIVGEGTAGFAALNELIALEPDARILVVRREADAAYLRPPLSKDLWMRPSDDKPLHFRDWGGNESGVFQAGSGGAAYSHPSVDVLAGESVVDLDTIKKAVLLSSERVVEYDSLLLATGAEPRLLPAVAAAAAAGSNPEADPKAALLRQKVTTFRSLEDFERLQGVAAEAEHIVVVGGSFLGSELATGLAEFSRTKRGGSLRVTQVFPEGGMMALAVPDYLSAYATDRVRAQTGIDIRPGTLVQSVGIDDDDDDDDSHRRVRVQLDDGQVLVADHVVSATGVSPAAEVAVLADLEIDSKHGGVVVNAELEARSGVFAAGDVASYHDVFLGRRRVEHHDHAVQSGKTAARNMTGAREIYQHIPMFWGDLGDLGFEAVGILDNNLRTVGVWDRDAADDGARGETVRRDDEEEEAAPAAVAGSGGEEQPGDFKRGLVYYLDSTDRVVGVLLWNVWGRIDDARRVLKRGAVFPDDAEGDERLQHAISIEQDDEEGEQQQQQQQGDDEVNHNDNDDGTAEHAAATEA